MMSLKKMVSIFLVFAVVLTIGLPIYADEMRENSEKAEAVSDPPELPQTGAAPPDGGTPDEAAAEEPVPDGTAPDGTVPDGTVPDESVAAGDPAPPSESAGQNEDPVSPAEEAAGYAKNLSSPESIEALAGISPQEAGADLEVGVNPTATGTTGLSGKALQVRINSKVTGAPGGYLLILPILSEGPNDDKHTSMSSSGSFSVQYAGVNYAEDIPDFPNNTAVTIPGTSEKLDNAMLIWVPTAGGAADRPATYVNYTFADGLTPDGKSIDVKAWIVEAEGVTNNAPGRVASPALQSSSASVVKLTALANEAWEASKSITQPATAADQVFTDLRDRSYADVMTPDAEDSWTITYKVDVRSNKASGDQGRLYMQSVSVTDTLVSYGQGAPTSVKVYDQADTELGKYTVADVDGTTKRITWSADIPSQPAYLQNQTYYIKAIYNKNQYTKMLNGSGPPAVQSITNTAEVSYVPVVQPGATSTQSVADAAIGWKQMEPARPSLGISKYLKISGERRPYTAKLKQTYQKTPNVEFRLQEVDPADMTTPRPATSPLVAPLVTNETESTVSFANLYPGVYRLRETVGISSDVDIVTPSSLAASGPGALVIVTEPDMNGISKLYIDPPFPGDLSNPANIPADYTPASKIYEVTNESSKVGSLRIYPLAQQAFQYPSAYDDYYTTVIPNTAAPIQLMDGSVAVASGIADSTDSAGHYIRFENVPLNPSASSYTIKADGIDTNYYLKATRPYSETEPGSSGSNDVSVSSGEIKVYKAFMNRNKGGFVAGKIFTDSSGKALSPQPANFVASYKLYRDTGLANPLTSDAEDFTVSSASPVYIMKEFPAGVYYIKEVGLKIGGSDAGDLYSLEQSGKVKVEITAESFRAYPVDTDGNFPDNPNGHVTGGKAPWTGSDSSLTGGVFINRSLYAELAIQDFNYSGSAKAGNQYFISQTSGSGFTAKAITIPAGGLYKELVPAGTYSVEPYNVSGALRLHRSMNGDHSLVSGTTTLTVAPQTAAQPLVSVSNGNIIHGDSVQTVAFVWRYPPRLEGFKYRRDNLAGGNIPATASFSMYLLVTEQGTTTYKRTNLRATSDSTGHFIFNGYLEAGTWLLVETDLPGGAFMAPGYWPVFDLPGEPLAIVSRSAVDSLPADRAPVKIVIDESMYGGEENPTVKLSGDVYNVPYNLVNFIKTSSDASASRLPGVEFKVYRTLENARNDTASVQTVTTDSTGTAPVGGLAPGIYYVKETASAKHYILPDVITKIDINDNGWPTVTWEGQPPPASTIGESAPSNGSSVPVTTNVTLTNIRRPDLNFVKLGETSEWKSAVERQTELLPGAKFTLKDQDGNYYKMNDDGTLTNEGRSPSTIPYIISGTDGQINFKGMDPSKEYKLEEVEAPAIPGADAGADLKYTLTSADIKFKLSDEGTVWLVEKPSGPKPSPVGVYYELIDRIEPHHLRISKLPLKLHDGANRSNGFDVSHDATAPNFGEVQIIGGKFNIWVMNEEPAGSGNWVKGKLVNNLTIGNGNLGSSHYAWSRELPNGHYWVEEIETPESFSDFDVWDEAGTKGNQTSSVYVNVNGSGKPNKEKTIMPSQDPGWLEMPKHGIEIVITSEDEKIIDVVFGNSNEYAPPGWMAKHRNIRMYGEKDGYGMGITGIYEWASVIANAEFDVYPAFVDSSGAYHALPTVDGKPLTQVKTNDFAGGDLGYGQFMTDYFDISQAFYYGGQDWTDAAASSGPNPFVQFPLNTELSSSDNRIVPNGGEVIDWGKVSDDIKHKYANSYKSWSLIFIETAGTHLNNPGGTPPTSGAYEFDPSNPPTFGFTISNEDTTWTDLYENGNSNDVAIADAVPFHLKNYKGTGYIQFHKRAANSSSDLAGAVFSVYRCDPGDIDSSGNFKDGDVKKAFENASHVTNWSSSADPALKETTLKVTPGYYIIRESAAPAGLNDFGEWKTENFKGIAASERKGEFTSSLDNDGALDASDIIGPVVVYPTEQAGNWLQSTSLTVSDKVKPSVDIRNRWNGAIINDEGYSGTYDVTAPDGYFATGTTGKLVSKAEKTDATLSPLKDGIYTAKLAAAPAGISRTDYIQNAAASANEITFAVANSQVVTSGLLAPKLNGTAIPNNMEAAMTDGTGVWFTVDNGLVSIHVNHPSKGALVVRKGGISSEGGGRPAEADFSWQRINADGSDYAGPEPGPYSGSIKWAVAQDSVKTALEKGLYKVTETSTSTGWIKDDAPVYVQINETGEVYLRNNSATDGVLSSADKPLMPSVMATPEYFYNRSEEGTVEIKKFTSASDTQNLTDAEFDLFPTADGTTPSGPAAVHIVDSDPTPAAQYVATVPAGDYLIRETKAPTGRARRAEFIPVTVQPARQPEYVGYDNPANVNVKAVLNPLPINIRVAKETIYPAIGTPDALGYIPERRVRVVLLPMYLWHLKDGKTSNSVTAGDYDSVPGKGEALPGYSGYWATNDQTTADSPDEIGVTGSIPIMSTGEYRVTEQIAPLHDYLLSNPKYKMSGYTDGKAPPNQDDIAPDTILGNSGNTNLNVVYDAATNSLKVETDNGDWDADTNTLTIQNPFSGYVLLAQKLDYFTGEMVTLTATELAAGKTGAKFALYDDYNAAVAGDTTPGSGHLLEIREDAEGKGYVQFTPGFATEDKYFWVREIAPPSGYELDPWYDDAIKQLVVSAEGGPASGVRMVSFVDGPQTPAALTVEKTVMPGEKGAADGPAVTELSSGGFSTTYKVTQKPANNSLPLYSYVVNDGSATNRMFTFMGRNASNTEIEVPDVSGNNPGYRVTGVRIHPSVSFKSAKDEKNNAATPVYARVNGGAWQMLSESDATSFSVPAGTDQYLSVEYTDDKDATVPFVGTKFTPGAIEADVVFDKFQPTAAQTEVSRIVNTVTTDAAAKADGSGALVQSKDDAAIEIKVSERPVMKVDKTKTAPNYNPSTDPRNKVFAGSEGVLRFELKLTNATPSSVSSDLVIEDPVIMDYMQPETLTLHYYDANPDYTAYLNGEPYLGKVEFVKLSPNIYTWRFPDVTLHRDDYVSVELGVNVAKIVATPQVLNEVYGTSHALPLKPSLSFPTGASFVAANMASAEAVYEGNPASKAYWDKLAAIPGTDTKAFGLWVKSEAEGVTITNNGEITTMKSLQVNNGDFTASKTPVDIDIDDKVTFKLALQNDQQLVGAGGNTLTNIRVTDVLPRLTDGRGTDWTDQLRDYWKIDINNIKIYTLLDGDVKDKVLLTLGDTVSPSATSGQPLASDSKSMMFNFGDFDANSGNGTTFDDKGHYKLKPHDILYVEYSMGFDLSAIEANAALKTL
ncbi:MAG: hypothetical protein LBK04_04045, partial [Clostridiales Family XIII bacterium]|nr:hypothetical protein [Clostridiales Family XIII bacterium]